MLSVEVDSGLLCKRESRYSSPDIERNNVLFCFLKNKENNKI